MCHCQSKQAEINPENSGESMAWPDAGLEAALNLFKAINPDEIIMVDVGAHRGESLRSFSQLWSGSLKYVGLEPNPNAFIDLEMLSGTIRTNSRQVSCLQCAAGHQDGTARFLVTEASAVSGILQAINGLSERVPSGDHQVISEFEVKVVSVESLVSRLSLERVDLFKIDTEGYDLEVLRGAQGLLASQSVGAVLTEVFFVPYRVDQAYFWDIASFMSDLGYHFVNLYDTRETSQGRLYTGNALWVSSQLAKANDFL
jgi:FkbM family methyltransferase